MTKKEPEYRKRKPDYETESFRAWQPKGKKELAEAKKWNKDEEDPIIIEIGDFKLHLAGFNKVLCKKTKKALFAYKFKHEDKSLLYWKSPDKCEDQEKLDNAINVIKGMSDMMGYEMLNMLDHAKLLMNERHVLEKMGEK